MASVTGITAERAQAIENASVSSGAVDSTTGHLILETVGGTEIDAGSVVLPPITAWPVGSIFMAITSANPSTLLGGGTWVRWGQGRIPISLDSTDTDFDVAEETGGEKTHVLTTPEMPSHNHGVTDPGHSHLEEHWVAGTVNGTGGTNVAMVQGSNFTGTSTTGVTVNNTGGGGAHNNMPPYIVCYMWKRTA